MQLKQESFSPSPASHPPAAAAAAVPADPVCELKTELPVAPDSIWAAVESNLEMLFKKHSFFVEGLDQVISPRRDQYLEWLLTTLEPNQEHIQKSDFPITRNEMDAKQFKVHLANLAWKPKRDVRLPAGKNRVYELLPEIKTGPHDGCWLFATSPLRLRTPSGPTHEVEAFELEADKGCLRVALLHLIAFTAFDSKVDAFPQSTLAKSMNSIVCLSLHATSEQDRQLQIQRFQHKESLRQKTTVAGWICLLSGMKESGTDPQQFMTVWNADCLQRGCLPNAVTGQKEQAVKLWIQHPAQMKKVMAYVVSVGFPGNLPDKFFHENLLPGKKFHSHNANWSKTKRCKVTHKSWDLMWDKCLVLVAAQCHIEFAQCERAAKHAALLTASENEVDTPDAQQALETLKLDWKEGSANLNAQLDAAISNQAESWTISHLQAFSEALNEISEAKSTLQASAVMLKSAVGLSSLDKLELQRKELDGQVVEALESTYDVEMAKIKQHVMTESCVQKAVKRKQETFQTERYEESCKAAKLFYETNIQVLESGEKEKKTKLLLRLQGLLEDSVSSAEAPRYLALANFRVPASISTRDYDLSISMTSALLQHGKENAAAIILAPEYPQTGRRNADLQLVKGLHEHAVRVSGCI